MKNFLRQKSGTSDRLSFFVLLISQLIATTGFTFVMPFMPLYVRELGVESHGDAAAWAGFVNGASGLTMALAAPFWGKLADRIGRKAMLLRATLAGSVVLCLMGFVTSPWQLLFLRLLQGTLTGTTPAATALVGSSSPSEKVGTRLGALQMVVFLAAGIGPGLGGIFADTAGIRNSFFITASLLLVSGMMVLFGVTEDRSSLKSSQDNVTELEEDKQQGGGIGNISYRKLLPGMLALFVAQATISSVAVILPGFLSSLPGRIEHIASLTGWIAGTAALVASLGSVLTGRFAGRLSPWLVIGASLAFSGLMALPQAWAESVPEIWALRLATSLFLGGIIPTANLTIRNAAPPEKRGAAFGAASSAVALGFSAGPVGGGLIAAGLGFRAAFLIPGVLLLGLAVVLMVVWVARGGLPNTRRLRPHSSGHRLSG